jgi:hypothetical protein
MTAGLKDVVLVDPAADHGLLDHAAANDRLLDHAAGGAPDDRAANHGRSTAEPAPESRRERGDEDRDDSKNDQHDQHDALP